MADKNLDGSGLSEVWVRAAQLVKRFTGAVNLTKGDLQTQVDTKITGTAISSSSAITTQGEYALDAREKNASIEGTLANQIDALNSNLNNIPLTSWNIYGSEYVSIVRYYSCKFGGKIKIFNIIADVIDANCSNKVIMTFLEPLLAAGFYDFIIYCPGSDCRAVLRKNSSDTQISEMIINGELITGARIAISGIFV